MEAERYGTRKKERKYGPGAIQAKIEEAKSEGFCILKNHFPKETLLKWRAAFNPLLQKQIEIEGTQTSRGSNRFYVTLPFTTPFADPIIFEDADVLDIAEGLVGSDMAMCQLATDTPMLGSDYQSIHRDAPPLFPELEHETPAFQLAVNFPLVDVTPENGPLEVARKTHLMTKEEGLKRIESGEIQLEQSLMKLGDVMIRDVRGLHRGTPNRTQTPRPMAVIGYSRRWLYRPEVSILIPRTALAGLSDRACSLLRFNPQVDQLPIAPKVESYQTFSY